MKSHQILTGACNSGDRTFAVGSVEGVPFTAYAAGCNIVILAKNFDRVQIIPGVCHDNVQISCVDCSLDTGKIGAAYENEVIIFEPTPLQEQNSSHGLDYWWVETARLKSECFISTLAWNGDGDCLLTAGEFLQMWRFKMEHESEETKVKFDIGTEPDTSWDCVWKIRPANPVVYLSFSPDGSLFATASKHDRLVRIWYQNHPLLLPSFSQDSLKSSIRENFNFSYIYLAHPQSVTGISWRKTSKYMPRGSVSNMLITSCLDNICRLWSQTVLPEDGIISMQQLDPAATQDSKFRTHRQKARFIQRFKHMRQSFTSRRMVKSNKLAEFRVDPVATLPSTYSVHEFHNYGYQGTGVSSGGLHFHLSATINGLTDIPLVPTMGSATDGTIQNKQNFVLHWLNNKEMHFTQEAEKIIEDLFKIAIEREDLLDFAENNDSRLPKQQKPPTSPTSLTHAASQSSLAQSDVSQSGSAMSNLPKLNGIHLSDALDHRIESILNDWHQNSDLLYSIHPVDGSLLVWIADFMDEYTPGSFRQAQVSFSSRIPNAIPLGDAMTMSSNVSMYNAANAMMFRNLFKLHDEEDKVKDQEGKREKRQRYKPAPVVSMISKHTNGTLNLWNVMFAAKSKFAQLLNISHASRASGHRFRVNGITSHPVLPLVLTTSHHNRIKSSSYSSEEETYCSELILWRVDAVGPLSRSGGVSELARMNSPEISAFTDVAWIPTLLPSNTLGSVSNSPSTCFVASDGHSLRVYQAVIDARTLLAEMNSASRRTRKRTNSTLSVRSSDGESTNIGGLHENISEKFNIVSTQSSSKPGCIVELDAISDATHDWQSTLLLHAFQEQLMTVPSDMSDRSGLIPDEMSAIVDLRRPYERKGSIERGSGFNEAFYVLVAEKASSKVMMHMWKLTLSSEAELNDGEQSSGSVTPDASCQMDPVNDRGGQTACEVHVTTEKVCCQSLPLPEEVEVVHAVPAVGHLSSSSIYPACLAPYVMVTACSDQTIRFWKTRRTEDGRKFEWDEWEMESESGESKIIVPGRPVSVRAAYSGRIACAYQTGSSFVRPSSKDIKTRYVNLCVAIYECESTGGSEWILEDTIYLKNIELQPEMPPIDMTVYENKGKERLTKVSNQFNHNQAGIKGGLISVPSLSTLEGVRNYINRMGNIPSAFAPKQSVMLDWVSNEDGTHILTIAVGNKILLLTEVSSDISQANMKAMNENRTAKSCGRTLLRKTSSIGLQPCTDEIRWMQIRRISLRTADGLNPTPMAISWVRDGILMSGMDNEIAVYSQWREDKTTNTCIPDDGKDFQDQRKLEDVHLFNIAQESQSRPIFSVNSLAGLASSAKHIADSERRKKGVVMEETELMPDFGLFEASHLASPVLPQYHPKQLMELLNSGKIRWVKAILGHLVRCIGGSSAIMSRTKSTSGSFCEGDATKVSSSPRAWSKSRTLSVVTSTSVSNLSPGTEGLRSSLNGMPEELTLDYTEIKSIPPLPLWTLLAADKETKAVGSRSKDDKSETGYDDLFSTSDGGRDEGDREDVFDDDFFAETANEKLASKAADRKGLSYFGPRQARIFSKLLTHTHLPGLTSLDQMHLLALADTVASCQLDLAEKFAIDSARQAIDTGGGGVGAGEEVSLEALDDCGLRFLLAMKHFMYLQRCLPLNQRKQLQKQGLSTSNLVWGFHSESEEELLRMIPSVAKGNPTWPELRELGVAWWVRNNVTLRKVIEKVAKAAFQANKDPLDAAIFYLAMKKKSLVWGLYRSIKDPKMTQFFNNNFAEDRWRKAALKNAFALLGKQRFLHAAAFFLLSGSLKDAIDICIDKLDDLQLAMVIARLYEGDLNPVPDVLRDLLSKHILGAAEGGRNVVDEGDDDDDEGRDNYSHPDPFLRSIALWTKRDYSKSLATLIKTGMGRLHPKFSNEDEDVRRRIKSEADPSVFNFYIYLRTHPMIMRQVISKNQENTKAIMLSGFKQSSVTSSEDSVTPLERRLYFSTAHFHIQNGCPALTLDVLSKLPSKVKSCNTSSASSEVGLSKVDHIVHTGILHQTDMDLSQPKPIQKPLETVKEIESESVEDTGSSFMGNNELDWSQPLSYAPKNDDDELKLEWSDDPESDEDDENNKIKTTLHKDGDGKTDGAQTSSFISKDSMGLFEEETPNLSHGHQRRPLDIMAQQLKFIACLKIMMEELGTLATGFEVDGGLLRYQLYIWLEREVEALKSLCSYLDESSSLRSTSPSSSSSSDKPNDLSVSSDKEGFEVKMKRSTRRKAWLLANQTLLRTLLSYCSLHGANGGGLASVRMELILLLQELQQEKTPKQLLSPLPFPTTLPLLSACIAQQKTVVADPVRHLSSTTHDMLYTMMHEKHPPLPGMANYESLFVLRDLSVALSSCVYQSLSDSDSLQMKKFQVRDGLSHAVLEALSRLNVVYQDSSLITTTRKLSVDGTMTEVTTEPSKWPGVASLRALLDRDKDDDTPNLNVLLCETYVAVYMSLLSYSLASCDAHILYRLVSQSVSQEYWAGIFGGGCKRGIKVDSASSTVPIITRDTSSDNLDSLSPGNIVSTVTSQVTSQVTSSVNSLTKQRVKLNMKLLGVQLKSPGDGNKTATTMTSSTPNKQYYREQFKSPDSSIIAKLMNKPYSTEGEYDSNDESENEDDDYDEDDDPFSNEPVKEENVEHSDPQSFSWSLIRYAVIRLAQTNLEKFITLAGIEIPVSLLRHHKGSQESHEDLPVASPLIYGCLRVTETWIDAVVDKLNGWTKPPNNYLSGCFANSSASGPTIEKYKALFEPQNTPFKSSGHGVGPVKRLWSYLIRQDSVQSIFIKYIFGKRKTGGAESPSLASRVSDMGEDGTDYSQQISNINKPVKVIHKEHDGITAFCINKVSTGLMTLSTQKELQELDVSLLMNPASWSEGMNEETDFDILNLNEDPDNLPGSGYLVIQTPGDPLQGSQGFMGSAVGAGFTSATPSQMNSPNGQQPPSFGSTSQPRGSSVMKSLHFPGSQNPQFCRLVIHRSKHLLKPVKRHKIDGVRRLAAHSHLPLYVTGCQDGSIRMWEWSHPQPVQSVRPPGVFAKVNRVAFTSQGNKFGACDGDGNVSMWQAANASQPFFTYNCHNKQTSDFALQGGCSSLFCTAGHSQDGRNVGLWDTLMPQKRCNVASFTFHESGASAVCFAARRHQIVTAGKRGQVAIWDVRQQKQLHFFKAHEHPIKCLALDPNEEYFVTGSVDGDIKIWSLNSYKCFYTLVEEHARHGIFKNISQGVSQVHIDSQNRLFSCGADGSIKVRQLPDRDLIVSTI